MNRREVLAPYYGELEVAFESRYGRPPRPGEATELFARAEAAFGRDLAMAERSLDEPAPFRCPAGCGRVVDVTNPFPACADCGKRHCHLCSYLWPADDGEGDVHLCKRHYRIRQAMAGQAGESGGS